MDMSQLDPTTAYDHFQHARLDAIVWPAHDQLLLTLTTQQAASAQVDLHFIGLHDHTAVEPFFAGMVGQQLAVLRMAAHYQPLAELIATEVRFEERATALIIQSQQLDIRPHTTAASTATAIADGQSVLDWLEQELPPLIAYDWNNHHEHVQNFLKQLGEQVENLSAFDKQAILENLQHWEAIKAIGDMKILPDDEALRAFGEVIETISGLLGD
jgi:hypothetical protein